MSDTPIAPGSDAWFQQIADILTGSQSGGAPATDAAIAGLVTSLSSLTHAAVTSVVEGKTTTLLDQARAMSLDLDTQLRAALVDLFTAGDTSTLSSANAYTDQQVTGAGVSETFVEESVAAGVTNANAYTDDAVNSQSTVDRTYTDTQLATAASVASSYADAGDTATGNAANAYTDAQIDFIFTSLTTLMDNKDVAVSSATLQAAIDYVTAHPGGGASSAYVDNGDATTLASAKTYADNGDAANLTAAKTYADGRYTAANTYADNKDVTNLAAAKTYADQYAVADTGWVTIAPPAGYTDRDSLAYRKRGTRVELRGGLNITTGSMAAVNPLFTLPVGARPGTYVVKTVTGSGVTFARVDVNTSGVVSISAVSGTTTYLYFNAVEFYTD